MWYGFPALPQGPGGQACTQVLTSSEALHPGPCPRTSRGLGCDRSCTTVPVCSRVRFPAEGLGPRGQGRHAAHRCGCACGSPGSWRWGSSCGTGGRGRCARWGTAPWACPLRPSWPGSWHLGGWRSSRGGGLADCARCGTRCHSPCTGRRPLWEEAQGGQWPLQRGPGWTAPGELDLSSSGLP